MVGDERFGRARDATTSRWLRLGDRLWAGWQGMRCLGTIEHGSRFVWVDPDGRVRGRYRALDEAESAAQSGQWSPMPPKPHPVLLTAGVMTSATAIFALGWMTGALLPG